MDKITTEYKRRVCWLVKVFIILQYKYEHMHCSVQDGRQFADPRIFLFIPGHLSVSVISKTRVMLEQ